ncbi:major facilitator superfamily transporter [Phlyctema vagabunda]|uniref:Major facilitator superfamily transporter n=1 Tax=Phlyctema vagabunda TaxID=108571 RepID=A0ABR4PY82_9HELO
MKPRRNKTLLRSAVSGTDNTQKWQQYKYMNLRPGSRLSTTSERPTDSMADDKNLVQSPKVGAVSGSDSSDGNSVVLSTGVAPEKAPWWSYIWDYEPTRTPQERKFIQKLDFYLLTILSLGYFIKNLDQTNIANAYVSGMKEDLKMNGNQINLVDVAWTTGYVVGQLPSQVLLTKIRPSVWIPACEIGWTILTFGLAATNSSTQVIVIRFFIGLLESIFYPAAHFLIGSWYTPAELGKRACIFHASSAAAGMFSGYLQAAVYKNMNGTHGLAGWQWLFVMDGIISLPIAIAGFWLYPDFPETTRAFYLKDDDRALAQARMRKVGRKERQKLGWGILKRIFGRWHVYALTLMYIIFINGGPSSSVNPFSLWLKARGYPVSQINIIPTGQSAVQLVFTVGLSILSDFLRNRALVMSIATAFGLLSTVLLVAWTIPTGLRFFAFFFQRSAVVFGPLSMSWANEICSGDAEERALVLGIMNASGYAFNAWLPVLTYPVTDAPRFLKGFIFTTCAYVAQFLVTGLIAWLQKREVRGKEKEAVTDDDDAGGQTQRALSV